MSDAFQSSVAAQQGFGVVGELFLDGPTRAQPGLLDSGDAANNVIGRAFTITEGGSDALPTTPIKVQAGGVGVFAGILANPKTQASYGTADGGPLAPTLVLPNDRVAEFVQMGTMIISLPGGANIGDWLVYATATGIISAIAPDSAVGGGYARIRGAEVDRYNAGPGLAVVTLGTFQTEPMTT